MSILSAQVEQLVQDAMKRGGYSSADDVVRAGIASLQQHAVQCEFQAGEMETLLEEGERSGASLDGEEILAELRALRIQNRGKAG